MVTRTRECLLCSGTAPAVEMVHISRGNAAADVPVCSRHNSLISALFDPVLTKRRGRPRGSTKAVARKKAPAKRVARRSGSVDIADVRAWAGKAGYRVGARGRIPADVMNEYKKASRKKK